MALFSIKLSAPTADIKTMERHASNVLFGVARGLTKLAQEGQAASQGAIRGKFNNRKNWFTQQSQIGVKIKPATKGDPVAEIRTAARFLPLQDSGGIKLPYHHHICIPYKKGPLGNKKSIPDNLRPKAVMDSGKGFIRIAKGGGMLMMLRTGKGGKFSGKDRWKGVVVLYTLVPKAKIKRADVFDAPITTVVRRRGPEIIDASLRDALKGKS